MTEVYVDGDRVFVLVSDGSFTVLDGEGNVDNVARLPEVAEMLVGDDTITEDAWQDGYDHGRGEGYSEEEIENAREEGYNEGYDAGYSSGYDDGYSAAQRELDADDVEDE